MTKFDSARTYSLTSPRLPLWERVVFVDWNGVLSREPFWASILLNERHPYRDSVSRASSELFGGDLALVQCWMRGTLSSAQVLEKLNVSLDRRAHADYLLRRLYSDCRKMRCDSDLVTELQRVRRSPSSLVVLATDNMDCFADQLHAIKSLVPAVDAVLASPHLGVLKTDSVLRFFQPWLTQHSLRFEQAILLDDSAANCIEFQKAGGTAVICRDSFSAIAGLRSWVDASGGWGLP